MSKSRFCHTRAVVLFPPRAVPVAGANSLRTFAHYVRVTRSMWKRNTRGGVATKRCISTTKRAIGLRLLLFSPYTEGFPSVLK